MFFAVSDKAQTVWQNMVLISYASTIVAIPLGDSLLFSFTTKKPLAIGVARSVFVSCLGGSLAMIMIFGAWLTIESIHPNLHIDHFFYEIVEKRLKAQAFYRLILIFLAIESALMTLTVIVGGFLASITPFVGEQNQNKTKFTFTSLLMDVPLGLSTISFIQAIIWCIIKYIDHFRRPTPLSIQDEQGRMMMVNNRMNNAMKANRRVTFKTGSDSSISSSKRCSDVSRTSSTYPILKASVEEEEEEEAQGISRAASSSSSSTLLPTYLNQNQAQPNSGAQSNHPGNNSPAATKVSPNVESSELTAPPPLVSESRIRLFGHPFKPGGTSTIPPIGRTIISKPSPVAESGSRSNNRFQPGTVSRYAWLRNQNKPTKEENFAESSGPFTTSLPYSRVGRLGKIPNLTGRRPYQRVALQTSTNDQITSQSSINTAEFKSFENENFKETSDVSKGVSLYPTRKSLPEAAIIEMGDEKDEYNPKGTKSYAEDDGFDSESSDEWAETQSQMTEEKGGMGTPYI